MSALTLGTNWLGLAQAICHGRVTEPEPPRVVCAWCDPKALASGELVSHTICSEHEAQMRAEAGLQPRAAK